MVETAKINAFEKVILMARKIIHIDADCFYAAIEMRDNPSLRGIPMAVGGSSDRRGVIATCNYEARAFGVRSAMSSATALRKCPQLVLVKPRFDAYREASMVMRSIFADYTHLIEPLSLDEAYLDVSECQQHSGSATLIAEDIRARIESRLGITVSAGVSNSKFLAKIASDWHKPNGLCVISPDKVEQFVLQLPVSKIHGVGKVTAQKLHDLGIQTCLDVRSAGLELLKQHFGDFSQRLYDYAHGIDHREVNPDRVRKSVSVEHTYAEDLSNGPSCMVKIPELLQDLQQRLAKLQDQYGIKGAFVKVKFSDFTSTTVERSGSRPSHHDYECLMQEALNRSSLPVRLLGLGVRLDDDPAAANLQIPLF